MEKSKKNKNKEKNNKSWDYKKFQDINGNHPIKDEIPESCVEYSARVRSGAKVAFFNFDLAKEIGLIPKDHPDKLNKLLEKNILDTFSIVIINEYDQINKTKIDDKDIKENTYMATRYLQLQHKSKKGETSGDGRSIWNGQIESDGITWDISSCGTGATKLSPATSLNNKFFKTGDPTISYGCGYSEIDEGFASLFFSEVLNKNNINTERILVILEFTKGISINVRAQKNLLRPSHFFRYLKQNDLDGLTKLIDYHISRQINNKEWQKPPTYKNKYDYFLEKVTDDFARSIAVFEDEYIFCWIDWDGDNILMDGGIIDYGSVRQFGLFHQEYRYDDEYTFSTTIAEQKQKARYLIQCFSQAVGFIKKGKKQNIKKYASKKATKEFDKLFVQYKYTNLLGKIGFKKQWYEYLLNECKTDVRYFQQVFQYFERVKSKKGIYKVQDGITQDAVFCMRDILRELPQLLLAKGHDLSSFEFINILKSNYAIPEDLIITDYRKKMVVVFQKYYMNLIKKVSKKFNLSINKIILELTMRSSVINKYDRITGDAITTIANRTKNKRSKMSPEDLHTTVKEFAEFQNFNPDKIAKPKKEKSKEVKSLLKIVRNFREGL